jgi:hypothetical protein
VTLDAGIHFPRRRGRRRELGIGNEERLSSFVVYAVHGVSCSQSIFAPLTPQ